MGKEQQQVLVTEMYCVLQFNMAAIIKTGRAVFNEWVIEKMGKYAENFKAMNCISLYRAVTRGH
jgi:hypothetical protein